MGSFAILAITLESEHDRRRELTNNLVSRNLPFTNISAISGEDIDLNDRELVDQERSKRLIGRPMSPSEVGCALSHKKAWEKIRREKIPYAVVVESDIQVVPEFREIIGSTLKAKQNLQFVDLIYHRCWPSFWGREYLFKKYRLVRFANNSTYYSAAYLLSYECAGKLLDNFRKIYLPVDVFLTGGLIEKGIEMFAIYPTPVTFSELSAQSSIQAERAQLGFQRPSSWWLPRTVKRTEKLLRRIRAQVLVSKKSL